MEKCVYDFEPSRIYRLVEQLGPESMLSRDEVAAILGVKPTVVDQWTQYQGLSTSHFNAHARCYRWRDVVSWLSQMV